MFHRPSVRLAALATVVAGALVWPAASFACSPPSCQDAWFGPAVIGTVPANAALLPLQLPYVDSQPVSPLSLVRVSTGQAVPYTLQTGIPAWLKLDAPLIAGEKYALTVVNGCRYLGLDGLLPPEHETLTFLAGPSAPIPTAVGELVLGQPKLEKLMTGTNAGSCTVSVDGVSQTVQLQPHPSLLPWLGVSSLELSAAGKIWARGQPGEFALAGQTLPALGTHTTRTNWRVYAACQELPQGASQGLVPGTPQLSALIKLPPGMAALETSATASLLCDPPIVPPDAGSGADSAADDAVAGVDTGTGGEQPLPLSPDSGCTAGRQAGPGSLVLLVAGLSGLVLLRRRLGRLGRS